METKLYFTPNDDGIMADNDAQSVQNAVDAAEADGCGRVVIPRKNARTGGLKWEFDRTVYLPSNMTVELDGCFIYLAEGSFCNVFSNSNFNKEIGRTLEGEQHDISIIGRAGATIDGGIYNGLHERNSLQDGMPHISVNTPLLFANINRFEIGGFRVTNQRWWGMTFIYCRNGHIHDIDFEADRAAIDEEGKRRPDLVPTNQWECYIKNADGIDLRCGCENFTIENISGYTEDDTVALTALTGKNLEEAHSVEGKPSDICRVTIRNVKSDGGFCANIRLTCGDRNKIHDVDIDGVFDTSFGKPYMAGAGVRLDNHNYGRRAKSEHGDMYNISIANVHSRAKSAVEISRTIKNLSVRNIFLCAPYTIGITDRTHPSIYENVHISGIYSDCHDENSAAFLIENTDCVNVTAENIMPGLKVMAKSVDCVKIK